MSHIFGGLNARLVRNFNAPLFHPGQVPVNLMFVLKIAIVLLILVWISRCTAGVLRDRMEDRIEIDGTSGGMVRIGAEVRGYVPTIMS